VIAAPSGAREPRAPIARRSEHLLGVWVVLREVHTGSEAYDSAVSSSLTVRSARDEDAAQMARVNVRCWQETYRGLMSDAVLDDPGFLAARETFWTAALTDERYRENRVAVAERDGELVGIAMSGPPLDAPAAWARQLYVLYVYAAHHGTGVGPALLRAVVDPQDSVALWVADQNPRALAFYRKHGFVADGTSQVEDGVREIRMIRAEILSLEGDSYRLQGEDLRAPARHD
jgi:ribosomal protein S18 acetylase RimI-like enzyme